MEVNHQGPRGEGHIPTTAIHDQGHNHEDDRPRCHKQQREQAQKQETLWDGRGRAEQQQKSELNILYWQQTPSGDAREILPNRSNQCRQKDFDVEQWRNEVFFGRLHDR